MCLVYYSSAFNTVNHIEIIKLQEVIDMDKQDLRLSNMNRLQTAPSCVHARISSDIQIKHGVTGWGWGGGGVCLHRSCQRLLLLLLLLLL